MKLYDELFLCQAIIYRSSLSSLLPPQELGSVFALLEVDCVIKLLTGRSDSNFMTAGAHFQLA